MAFHDAFLRLSLLQLGLTSSIGADVATSCASARAGLSRLSEVPYTIVGPDGDSSRATGHQADYLTKGFRGDSRLIRLLTWALRDLSDHTDERVWGSTLDVYVAISSRFRDDPDQEIGRLSSPWELMTPAPEDVARGRVIAERAMALAGIRSRTNRITVITRGQASVGVALEDAALNSASSSLALILAADAAVDADRLASLDKRGRLKGPDVPTGAAPGEIGACMLVAGCDVAHSLQLPAAAQIIQPQSLESQSCFNTNAPPDGRSLAALADAVVRRLPAVGLGQEAWCIVDLNGEPYRAREWGTAVVHMAEQLPSVDTDDVWIPALHFGDCGAGTGIAAIAMAVRGFARRYAPRQTALILSAADGTTRTACGVSEFV